MATRTTIPPQLRRLAAAGRGDAPKHVQLSEAMRAAVASGHWRTGERLPTEVELARALPFSLGTVQRALRELSGDGTVVRRQRAGTFVAAQRTAMADPWHCRFLDDDGDGYLPIHAKVVQREHCREAGPWARHLRAAGDGFARIDRAIDVNGEFTVHSRIFLDAERFPGFLDKPLAELEGANFKHILAREYRISALRFAHTLRVQAMPRAISEALGVPARTVGSLLEAAATGFDGGALYYQQFWIPPNPRRLAVSDAPAVYMPDASRRKAPR